MVKLKIKYIYVSKKRYSEAKSQGYISTIKGKKYMLILTNKGTALVPIKIRKKE